MSKVLEVNKDTIVKVTNDKIEIRQKDWRGNDKPTVYLDKEELDLINDSL